MIHSISLSFNGGEITQYLSYLTNFAKHASSCSRMENFLPMPFGGFRKRPGTQWLAVVPDNTRIEAFTFTDGTSNIFAFHPAGIIIFDTDGTEIDTISKTITNPFLLQFSQINDVIEIASSQFHPCKISSVDGITWTLEEIPFSYPQLLDENRTASHTLTVPGSITVAVAASFTLTSSTSFFTSGHVGAFFKISKKRAAADFERSLTATNGTASTYLLANGIVYFSTSSTSGGWTGTFKVQTSPDNSTWTDVREFSAVSDRNVPVTEIDLGANMLYVRIRYDGTTAAASRGILAVQDAYSSGLCKITAYTNATTVTAQAVTLLPVAVTQFWNEGAFSAYQGFPSAITLHDRRRIFAGTTRRPMSIWGSGLDDFDNFLTGTDSESGFYRTLASTLQSPIKWLASQRRLFCGTEDGEWVIGSDTDALLSPENFLARQYTAFGSNNVPAFTVNDSVYFVERQGNRLRELAYILERESYDAADLTRLAEHISSSGITQMSFQYSREPYLWCTTNSGNLLAFAYNRREDIAAWSRHTTLNGTFTSVTVKRNDTDDDDVFVIARRIPEGGDDGDAEYHLEKLARAQQRYLEEGDFDGMHYVDSGVIAATTGGNNTVTLPAHLEGATVNVLSNGISYVLTVNGGEITLPEASSFAHVGLPVESVMETLPLDIPTDNGTSHSRRKRANELKLNVFQTFGGSYSYDNTPLDFNYTSTGDNTDEAPPLRNGWIASVLPPAHLEDLTMQIRHTEPYPFLCRAAIISWTLHEP